MGFWGSETHAKSEDASGFHAGTRRNKPHSAKGWTHNRDSGGSSAKTSTPPASIGGFSWTGRKPKGGKS